MQDRRDTCPAAPPIVGLLLLLGLGFFFGLAFEEFHARSNQKRPGGVRSFPLLALTGALLYRLDPAHLVPLSAGLLALSAWLTCYYWRHLGETDAEGFPNVGLMVPICNVLAYLLGPVALAEPPWVAVGATVAAVLLLTARQELHGFARRIELAEIVNAGRFLLLTGFVLPLLPDTPVTDLTPITPHQVWLAMVAVCTVSYASYLLQRYVAPPGAGLLVALLGGLYSSTATTLVLARRARDDVSAVRQSEAGIVLATAVMYLRLLIIIFVFSRELAMALAPPLLVLSALGLAMALGWYWIGGPRRRRCGTRRGAGQSAGTGHRRDVRRAVRGDLDRLGVGHAAVRFRGHLRAGGDRRRVRHRSVRAEPGAGGCGADHRPRRRGRHPGGRVVEQPGEGGVCDCVFRRARARRRRRRWRCWRRAASRRRW